MTPPSLRPAAFVDRDGTVIVERDYLSDPAEVELITGAADALRRLEAAGYPVVITTNQSGIGRGYYGEEEYRAVRARLDALLAGAGVRPLGTYHCPHHPDFTGPCDCRKPAPGLFLRAAREHGLDPSRSLYIGDRARDVEPGVALGGRGALVRTGYGREEESALSDAARGGLIVADDLAGAVERLLAGGGGVDSAASDRVT